MFFFSKYVPNCSSLPQTIGLPKKPISFYLYTWVLVSLITGQSSPFQPFCVKFKDSYTLCQQAHLQLVLAARVCRQHNQAASIVYRSLKVTIIVLMLITASNNSVKKVKKPHHLHQSMSKVYDSWDGTVSYAF